MHMHSLIKNKIKKKVDGRRNIGILFKNSKVINKMVKIIIYLSNSGGK